MTTDNAENSSGDAGDSAMTPYSDATEAYLRAATWLDPLADAPFVVQARMVARSLDRQLNNTGEVQSALASTYSKALAALDRRRPAPEPDAPDPTADSADGTLSIFTQLSE